MGNPFFEHPILNSPYAYPARHWELDDAGQPTQKIVETRRKADFITPIPKVKRQRGAAQQASLVLDDDQGFSTDDQQYAQAAEDPLNLIVEIKGDRGEDAKEKANTMKTYWVPGVNHLGNHGRWAFVEFTDVWAMQEDCAKQVETEFDKMLQAHTDAAEA